MKGFETMASIDLHLNPPTSKKDLTDANLYKFFIDNGTPEDCNWYADLLEKHTIKKTNNLTGKVIDGYDWPVIREEVAKKFFPDVSATKKKEKKDAEKGKKKETGKDRINNLRNKGKKTEE